MGNSVHGYEKYKVGSKMDNSEHEYEKYILILSAKESGSLVA